MGWGVGVGAGRLLEVGGIQPSILHASHFDIDLNLIVQINDGPFLTL